MSLALLGASPLGIAAAAGQGSASGAPHQTQAASSPAAIGHPEDTLLAYYAALRARDYGRAYALWGHGGQASGQTLTRFRTGFAETRTTAVRVIGPVQTEGAAGSVFATVPVEIRATLKDGHQQRFVGTYTLRRNNTGTGDPQTWQWHIFSASLRAQP